MADDFCLHHFDAKVCFCKRFCKRRFAKEIVFSQTDGKSNLRFACHN